MDRKRQRELALGAVAGVLLVVAAWSLLSGQPQSSATSPANSSTHAQARPKSPIVDVDLKALEAERPEPQEGTRNPFRFKPKPPPAPPPPTAAQVKQKQQQAAAEMARGPIDPPPPPRIPLKYIGDMSDPKNPGKRIAILSDARSTYYGREGEIVEGRYRIMRIGVESIELAYLDGRGRQTIRQTGQ